MEDRFQHIGSNIKTIGTKAFYGCKKLEKLIIKTKYLKAGKVGKNAFKGIKSNATIKVPKKKYKAYKSLLQKRGVGRRAAKTYEWNVNVDDTSYKIEFSKNTISIHGGEAQKLKKFKNQSKYPHMEYYIPIGSKEVVLNLPQGREPVLTTDGRDCVTGEPFELVGLPKWAWIFVVLHFMNFFFIMGGVIGGGCLGGFGAVTTMVASNDKMSTGKRVGICVAIWLSATVLEFILAFVFAVLFSRG